MKEFLAMGGYGVYVWSSYALAFIVLVANLYAAMRRRRRAFALIRRRLRREGL